MKVLDSAAMREADRRTIEELGLPGAVLMETAGLRVLDFINLHLPEPGRVVVAAGPGNNGGDGLVIARLLNRAGFEVSLWTTVKPGAYRGDAGINEHFLNRISFPVKHLLDQESFEHFRQELNFSGLIVDALLGTGLDREVEGGPARVIDCINECSAPVLAVDIPSGINADTGAVMGCAVKADWTVTFAFPKRGLLLYPGAGFAGEVAVGDINVPAFLVDQEPLEILTSPRVREVLPVPPGDAHKGTMGRVMIVSGSPGMTGAAVMAAESALKSGAGLVYLAAPKSICPALEAKTVEVITVALPEKTPGIVDPDAAEDIIARAASCDVLAVGPGLDPGKATLELVRKLLNLSPVPLVLDAGALEALGGSGEILKSAPSQTVITPHPGEMGRLTGLSSGEVQKNRLEIAGKYARAWNCIVLLKGANTVIASPGGRAAINPTGGPSLASAGSGDLLTGLIASLIAQGLEPEDAAGAGAYIHGLAGDLVPPGRGHMVRDVMVRYKQAFQCLEHAGHQLPGSPYLTMVRPVTGGPVL